MDADFLNRCEQVFDASVETLFQEILKGKHDGVFEAPLIGGLWAIADAGSRRSAGRRLRAHGGSCASRRGARRCR
jgi:hypothetical protein